MGAEVVLHTIYSASDIKQTRKKKTVDGGIIAFFSGMRMNGRKIRIRKKQQQKIPSRAAQNELSNKINHVGAV